MDAECLAVGHSLRIDNMSNWSARNGKIEGPNGPWPGGPMPHVFCDRCLHVWIVISKDGRNYNHAEKRFRERLIPTDPEYLAPTP